MLAILMKVHMLVLILKRLTRIFHGLNGTRLCVRLKMSEATLKCFKQWQCFFLCEIDYSKNQRIRTYSAQNFQ